MDSINQSNSINNITKQELEKLSVQLKKSSELDSSNDSDLDSNFDSDDDSDSDYKTDNSDLDSNTSDDSENVTKSKSSKSKSSKSKSSKSKSKTKSKTKSNSTDNNLIKIYKKNNEIKNLEKQKHYKMLELNNLNLDNLDLKDKIQNLSVQLDNNNNMLNLILSFINLNNKRINIYTDDQLYYLNIEQITLKMIEIKNKYNNFKLELETLKSNFNLSNSDNIINIYDSDRNIKLKECYLKYIENLSNSNEKNYNKNIIVIENSIKKISKSNELKSIKKSLYYIMIFFIGFCFFVFGLYLIF
jgi:hypothetical protein